MSIKLVCLFFVLFPFVLSVSDAGQPNQNQNNQYMENSEDVWFGPGYYYGTWFDNENEYWGWRSNHRDYPANRNYYNHDHPVYYEHGGEREGGREGGGGHGGGRR